LGPHLADTASGDFAAAGLLELKNQGKFSFRLRRRISIDGNYMSSDFHLDRYLARIGFQGKIKPDLATLAAIHAAHVDAIAFDGLDPFLGRPVGLELASVQAKLVDSR